MSGTKGTGEGRLGVTRRELIATGAAAGASLALAQPASAAGDRVVRRVSFSSLPDRVGWPGGWVCRGVANLRVRGGRGVLEAGSDVFPYDPRPVAFAVDARILDGRVRAVVSAPGSLVGVALRRTGPRDYYAAFYDSGLELLSIVRRTAAGLVTLARMPVTAPGRGVHA